MGYTKKAVKTDVSVFVAPYKWKKGIPSPNPTGRPIGLAREIRALTGGGIEMIHCMIRIMRGEKVKGHKWAPKYETMFEAAKWLAEQTFGKAPLTLTANGTGQTFELQKLLYVELMRHTNEPGVLDVTEGALLEQGLADKQPVQDQEQGQGDNQVQAEPAPDPNP